MTLRLLCLLCLVLAACGQSGALYLPQKTPAPATPQKKQAPPAPGAPAPQGDVPPAATPGP
jgi:predicted small lipoprotein YifL